METNTNIEGQNLSGIKRVILWLDDFSRGHWKLTIAYFMIMFTLIGYFVLQVVETLIELRILGFCIFASGMSVIWMSVVYLKFIKERQLPKIVFLQAIVLVFLVAFMHHLYLP